MTTYTFTKLYDGSERPDEYGAVKITYEEVNPGTFHAFVRPVHAGGFICPLEQTTGRKSAPEPRSRFRIAMTKRVPKKFTDESARNTGRPDMDKGHIIALELGGPDVEENICPQFSQLQRNGEWRQMEVAAHAFATTEDQKGARVMMDVFIHYSNSTSVSRGRTAQKFTIRLTSESGERRVCDIFNRQDKTDFMMAARVLAKADPMGEGDSYTDPTWEELQRPALRGSRSDPQVQTALDQHSSMSLSSSRSLSLYLSSSQGGGGSSTGSGGDAMDTS